MTQILIGDSRFGWHPCASTYQIEIGYISGTGIVAHAGFCIIQIDFCQTKHIGIDTCIIYLAESVVCVGTYNIFLDIGTLAACAFCNAIGVSAIFDVKFCVCFTVGSYRVVSTDFIVYYSVQSFVFIVGKFFP